MGRGVYIVTLYQTVHRLGWGELEGEGWGERGGERGRGRVSVCMDMQPSSPCTRHS